MLGEISTATANAATPSAPPREPKPVSNLPRDLTPSRLPGYRQIPLTPENPISSHVVGVDSILRNITRPPSHFGNGFATQVGRSFRSPVIRPLPANAGRPCILMRRLLCLRNHRL